MTPEQCRAARALLRWTVRQLSEASGVAENTISIFEARSAPDRNFRPATLTALKVALKEAGVVFLNGGSPGVRLRPAEPDAE